MRTFRLPSGQHADFDILQGRGTVAVLALTPEMQVVLAKQFRPGPELIMLELPGGAVDPGEEPEKAARRELLEETGYIGDFQFIGSRPISAYNEAIQYNFIALKCRKIQEVKPDELEIIEVVEMSLPEFRQHLRRGALSDVGTGYLGLDFLNLL
jgi:ADP-ribose pyrophosphatase